MKRIACSSLVATIAAGALVPASLAMSRRHWEVALVHVHHRSAAAIVLAKVKMQAAAEHLTAVIELDGKGDFEVSIVGFPTQKAAAAGAVKARVAFKHAAVERA